jgi:dienelactone hydrolase
MFKRERDFVKTGLFTASLLVFSFFASSASFGAPLAPITPAERLARAGTLQHVPWNGKSTNKGVADDFGCTIRTETIQVDDPVTKTSKNYDLVVQWPQSAKPVPVIIIVPTILGTSEYIEPVVAHELCNAGYGSIIADVNDVREPAVFPAWGAEDTNSRRAILALETTVDFAQRIPQFDANNIGGMGLSLGGITASLWTGVDSRLKASVIIVGGGNMPYTLAHSDDPRVVSIREKRMKTVGIPNENAYDAILRTNVTLDPYFFGSQVDHRRVLMVMADSDTKVPYITQQEQFVAFGKPQSITLMGGHETAIGAMVYLYMDDVTAFLDDRLKRQLKPLSLKPITHKVIDLDKLGY